MRITALSRARYNCEASSMAVREWNWIPDIWGVGCSRYMRGAPSNPPPPSGTTSVAAQQHPPTPPPTPTANVPYLPPLREHAGELVSGRRVCSAQV